MKMSVEETDQPSFDLHNVFFSGGNEKVREKQSHERRLQRNRDICDLKQSSAVFTANCLFRKKKKITHVE